MAWPNEVEEEEGAIWLAEALAPEVVPFSSEGIGINNLVFRTEVAVKGRADLIPKISRVPRPWKELSSGTAVGVTKCVETVAETPGKSGKNLGQKITDAFPSNSTEHRSPVKERNLGNEPHEKKKKR